MHDRIVYTRSTDSDNGRSNVASWNTKRLLP
ncbi:pyridoxine 5'-phosphate oxidase C-terminal domain-containing protein [Psychrobacter immobilis]|nr:pyridoxine 5'-phosphate oxidase C-terminal domain-containing protein [Psychrobacter immobilis]